MPRTTRLVAGAAVAAPLLAASAASAQVTNNWEGDVNFNWHQLGNWSQLLPPDVTQRVSINPYSADTSFIQIFRDAGVAEALRLTVRDWNCPPAGCSFDASILGFAGSAGDALLRLEDTLLVEADYSTVFGSGEANLSVANLDIVCGDVLVNELNGADATLELAGVDLRIRPGTGDVVANPGTVLTLDGAHLRALQDGDTFQVVLAPTSTLVTGGSFAEATIRDATLIGAGSAVVNGTLRTDALNLLGTTFLNGTLVVDGDGDSQHTGTILGAGTLVKDGRGTLVLVGLPKSTVGGTTVRGGALEVGTADQLGAAPVRLDGGTFRPVAGGFTIADAAFVLQAGGGTIDTVDAPLTITSLVSGGGALVKTGPSTLALHGANTFTGGTTVAGGVLQANNTVGSALGHGPVTVADGGTLSGTGSLPAAAPVTVADGGCVRPGLAAPFTTDALSLHTVTFESGSRLAVRLAGTAESGYDRLASGGTVTVASGAVLEVSLAGGFAPQPGDAFVIVDAADTIGTFDALELPAGDWCLEADGLDLILRFESDCGGGTDPVCPGDVDHDLAVGFDDLLAVLGDFGGACAGCPTDFDEDGDVDFDDLLVVIANWGTCS